MAKLCVISHKQFFGGTGRYVTTGGFAGQIDALAPHFTEVVLCVPVARGEAVGTGIRSGNVRIVPLPGNIKSTLKFYLKLVPLCRALVPSIRECDLVETRLYGNVGLLGLLLAKLMKKALIVHVSSDHEDAVKLNVTNSLKGRLFNLYLTMTVRAAHLLMARGALNFVIGGNLSRKFTARGIQVREMHPGVIREKDIRKDRLDTCRGDAVSILWVGRLTPLKGVNHIIEAFEEVGKRGVSAKLTLVGHGPEENALKSQVKRMGLERGVEFKGYIPYGPELLDEYRKADCFVLASFREGFPKVLLEAMSQGVPIVTTGVGGIPFLVKHEENGLLVPSKNSGALADAICRIIAEPETRQKLIRNGLATAEAHTVEKETEKFIAAVRERYPALV